MRAFISDYNLEVDRYKREKRECWPQHIRWDGSLKLSLLRGQHAEVDPKYLIRSLYRPFSKRWLYLNRVVVNSVYQWSNMSGRSTCITDVASGKPFMALACDIVADLHLVGAGAGTKCFPLSHLKDSAIEQFRKHYADDSIAKEDVFHYIYALLHHPDYRDRYAANLKRELPRIPFAPDFAAFATAGKELARLHVEYESLAPWPLQEEETKGVPYSQRVEKMKLSADRQSLKVNESLTLRGIPAEAFEYRLGSRSALEWVIDQYQVKGDSDPNREDDPGYIVRLVGQVVRVSVETARIVRSLPNYR
jgi:predicted helicase